MTSKPFILLAGMAILLVACAGNPDAAPGRKPNSTGSAGPASTARPQPTAARTEPGTTPHDGGPITIRPGSRPAPVHLHPGDVLTLAAAPSRIQPWQPPTSSDPAILRCTSRSLADGTLTATCHAVSVGIATVSTTTAPFAGDPHGPAQHTWTLTVHITPAT